MLRALITVVLILGSAASPEQAKVKPAASKSPDRVVASDYQPSPDFDQQAEQELLTMANQARAQAGAPPLQFDDGLIQAARAHAAAMAREQQLSHQLNGEPSLPHRLSAASVLHLDRSGENVALNSTADGAHQSLMLSPPHRENLLDVNYNVAGFAVIHSGDHLYVVQDFGHSLPAYTPEQTENSIAEAVNRSRRAAHLPALTRASDVPLRTAVCSMAQEDRLGTRSMHELAQRYSLVSYTNMHPEVLPAGANKMIENRGFKNVAIGACYARTDTYPSGVYWVGLLLY
ncbi:MAG TPA: CAP domain-containing protein [Terriglobales bacterium]|nr:CAP domain-containing protein [Terriglobales bacterium]